MKIPSEAIISSLLGEAGDDDLRTLGEWVRASPENEAELEALHDLWDVTGDVEPPMVSSGPPSVEAIIARVERPPVLETVGGGVPSSKPLAGPKRKAVPGPFGWSAAAAMVGLVAGFLLAMVATMSLGDRGALSLVPQEFRSGPNDAPTITFEDGSVVRLAPDTRVALAPDSKTRTVHLDGQAFFAVDASVRRPFRVITSEGEVTVVGTRFNARASSGRLDVAVVAGDVVMSSGDRRATVREGEVGRLIAGHEPNVESVDDIFTEISWLGNSIVLSSTLVEDVVTELSRRFDLTIRIEDELVRARTLSGSFAADSPIDIVVAICAAAGARCSMRNDTVVMREITGS